MDLFEYTPSKTAYVASPTTASDIGFRRIIGLAHMVDFCVSWHCRDVDQCTSS
jgi:hypothetical protein